MKPWKTNPWCLVDVETTGLEAPTNHIIEIALVRIESGKVIKGYSKLFKPPIPLPEIITKITGITEADLADKPAFGESAASISGILCRAPHIAAYNAKFDRGFVSTELERASQPPLLPHAWLDPLPWIWKIDKYERGKKLTDAAKRRGIVVSGNAHRAEADAEMAGLILWHIKDKLPDDLDEMIAGQEALRVEQDAEREAFRAKKAGG